MSQLLPSGQINSRPAVYSCRDLQAPLSGAGGAAHDGDERRPSSAWAVSSAGGRPGRWGWGAAGWDPEAVTSEPGLAFSSREEPGPGGPEKGCWGLSWLPVARGWAWGCAGWGCGHWLVGESGLELTEGWAGWGARFQGEAQQCAGRTTPRPGPTPGACSWRLSLTAPPGLLPPAALEGGLVGWGAVSGPRV